jgi:hypothetical protein
MAQRYVRISQFYAILSLIVTMSYYSFVLFSLFQLNLTIFQETYQIMKKKGHTIYTNWKASGQHKGDLKTKDGITDWCLAFCDGCKWAMYMAFQFEVIGKICLC